MGPCGFCLPVRDLPVPEEESAAMQGIRRWRAANRKKMVEDIEILIDQRGGWLCRSILGLPRGRSGPGWLVS
jgi:hypothetical protein